MMKKPAVAALCLVLICSLLAGCGSEIQEYEAPASPAPTQDAAQPEASAAAQSEATAAPGLGYAAFAPDTVAVVYNGQDITWREYYYWLSYYAGYIQYMSAMGAPFSGWDGHDYDQTMTNEELVTLSAQESMLRLRAVNALAGEKGLALDEADRQSIQDTYDRSADSYGDQNGVCSQEEAEVYAAYLDGQFIDRDLFDYVTGADLLADKLFTALYGQDGADMPVEEVLAWADSQGVLACKHILLMTVDPATGQALEEDVLAEKKAKADELYAQLAAVAGDSQALEALFDQLMQENSEDTGLAAYPDGYIFTPGVMVPEFESTTQALEEYGLSEPVQSSYGYHIILRLPVDPEGSCTGASGAAPLRASAASDAFALLLDETNSQAQILWQEGMQTPDIPAIFGQ